ncbi:hypothetical protein [Pseudomonas sp.]|uniref:AbiU2 domain-containing protein n=1 Tax=Pseudomonas sp. TaxID=306 RepID=UPI00260E1191|nr:hypothetical protein [Pseudomonas sp.]
MFDLETAFAELSRYKSYISDIQREVQLYEQLYCSESSRAVLNKNLQTPFKIIQTSMFISVLTRVTAIFDSKALGSFSNLSLDFLEHKYREFSSKDLLDEFKELKERFDALNIKSFRNKLIAHIDLDTVLGGASVSHNIKDGDIMRLLQDVHKFCIHLCEGLPGGMEKVIRIEPWTLKKGDDGYELLRRLEVRK